MLFASVPDARIHSLLGDSAHLQRIIEHTWEHLMIFNADRELVHQSQSSNRNFAFGEEDAESFVSLIGAEYRMAFMDGLKRTWGSAECASLEYTLNLDGAQPVWVQSTFSFVPGTTGQAPYVLVFSKEITQLKKYEAYLKTMAFNDPLTDLPNRRSLAQHFQQTAAFCKRYNLEFGVIYIDVDDFKSVNDNHGHAGGDRFLKHISAAAGHCLRDPDILARVGGDEFVALLHNLPSVGTVESVINRIYRKMAPGVDLDGRHVDISLSIGAAIYPIHGETLDSLLQSADSALYGAKQNSKNTYAIYV